ncbi:hypothetical protein ACWEWD_34440 [Streptomyces tendae]
MSADKTFTRVPQWARQALQKSVTTNPFMRNGIARMEAEEGVVLLQMLYREKRGKAVVAQYPFRDVQEAYDKAATEFQPRPHICYFIIATAPALRRAEANGVAYMRCWTLPGSATDTGAILRVPVSLWTESADA